jgi:hypothetical protein
MSKWKKAWGVLKKAWGVISVILAFIGLAAVPTNIERWGTAFAFIAHHAHWMTYVGIASLLAYLAVELLPYLKPKLKIELVPSSGPRPDVLLTVKNNGGSRDFYAQCTPLALHNSPNGLSRGTFDLKWEHTYDRCVPIGAGASRNLLIATFDYDHKNALATMELWELSGSTKKQRESSRWNFSSREKVPEYDLEISIFSDGTGPFSECFTLGAESWHGSPKMTKKNL